MGRKQRPILHGLPCKMPLCAVGDTITQYEGKIQGGGGIAAPLCMEEVYWVCLQEKRDLPCR